MATTVDDVVADLRRFLAEDLYAKAGVVRNALVEATRVKTGWAASNWAITEQGADVQTQQARSSGGRFASGSRYRTPGGVYTSQAQAMRAARGYHLEGPVRVVNLVRYVGLDGEGRGALSQQEIERVLADAVGSAGYAAGGGAP